MSMQFGRIEQILLHTGRSTQFTLVKYTFLNQIKITQLHTYYLFCLCMYEFEDENAENDAEETDFG